VLPRVYKDDINHRTTTAKNDEFCLTDRIVHQVNFSQELASLKLELGVFLFQRLRNHTAVSVGVSRQKNNDKEKEPLI
jgi:hypothetical protein